MTASDENYRAKGPNENHLQWQTRIAEYDALQRRVDGPVMPAEVEQHAEYAEGFVMHVETNTLARTKRNRTRGGIDDMHDRGTITAEQHGAAIEIIGAIELVRRDVSLRCANFAARVDNSGSAKGLLVERLAVVRVEYAYSRWRARLPVPRSLVIDMLANQQSMFATARSYGVGWPKARKRLIKSLDLWIDLWQRAQELDEEDLRAAHLRVGGGVIV